MNVDNQIDGYPVKHYDRRNLKPSSYRKLKLLLLEKYKKCYWCNRVVKDYPGFDAFRRTPPDDMATIDHIVPRQLRKRGDVVEKVLACYACNRDRNYAMQKEKVNQPSTERGETGGEG